MWILTYFLIGFVVAVFFAYKNYKLFKYIHWAKNFGDFLYQYSDMAYSIN